MTLDDWQEYLKAEKAKLAAVKDPRKVAGDDVELYIELRALAQNLEVYSRLKYKCGARTSLLEKHYAEKTLMAAQDLTESKLEALAINKQSKFKYIENMLYQERYDIDENRNLYKYFSDMRETTQEWIMCYKKQMTSV
jgi:hypothetical protein